MVPGNSREKYKEILANGAEGDLDRNLEGEDGGGDDIIVPKENTLISLKGKIHAQQIGELFISTRMRSGLSFFRNAISLIAHLLI